MRLQLHWKENWAEFAPALYRLVGEEGSRRQYVGSPAQRRRTARRCASPPACPRSQPILVRSAVARGAYSCQPGAAVPSRPISSPVANTHLGPGSLAAILGSDLEGSEDTIWIHQRSDGRDDIVLDDNNRWWRLHLDLIRACQENCAEGRYLVGCPDLIEGLDTLASLRGVQPVMLDMVDRPEELERQLQAVNDVWFQVFDRIYAEINREGEMAFCYFSLWAPGRMAKLQATLEPYDLAPELSPLCAAVHPPAVPET